MAENEETSGQGTGESEAAAENSNGAASSPEAGEADRAQSPGEQTRAQGEAASAEAGEIRLTGEKVLDIALGLGMLAAETLEKAISQVSERAKVAQQHAPAILDALEEKGRPAREKLLSNLRESNLYHTMKAEEGEGAAGKSADEEITALEERVRELEKQVDAPPGGGTSLPSGDLRFESRSSAVPEAPSSPSGETPAERATLDFAEQPQSLSHTPYDVSSDAPQAADEGPAIEVHPVTGTSREGNVDPPAASAAGDDSDAMTADETPLPETGSDASPEAAFDPEAPEKKKGRGRKSSGGAGADSEETS